MKNNRLTIIIAAVLVVIAGLLIWNNRYLSTIQGEASDFMVWDTATVTKSIWPTVRKTSRCSNASLKVGL